MHFYYIMRGMRESNTTACISFELPGNAITEQKISAMDLQYKMVLDPTCSVEGRVLFWKGRLTYKQAQSLRGDGFVKAIITVVADVP